MPSEDPGIKRHKTLTIGTHSIPCRPIYLFLFSKEWLSKATLYYTHRGHPLVVVMVVVVIEQLFV